MALHANQNGIVQTKSPLITHITQTKRKPSCKPNGHRPAANITRTHWAARHVARTPEFAIRLSSERLQTPDQHPAGLPSMLRRRHRRPVNNGETPEVRLPHCQCGRMNSKRVQDISHCGDGAYERQKVRLPHCQFATGPPARYRAARENCSRHRLQDYDCASARISVGE
jgi:hypothetical protein